MGNRAATVLMFLLGAAVTLAVVFGVMALTGGEDTPATTVAATTLDTTTSVPDATTVVSTTAAPTTSAATTTTAGPACTGGVASAAAAPGATIQLGDFDGDGAMDQLIGYESGGTHRVQMALATGYATEMPVFGPAVAMAAQPFLGDPRWLGIAQVDSGASTTVFAFFQLNGCDIALSTIDGSGEASFILGGGVMHLDGMVCTADRVTATAASTDNGTNWEYFTSDYSWDPALRTFHFEGMASSTLTSPADDGIIFNAADFSCPFGS